MGVQKHSKVNRLDELLEEGLLAPTWWLEDHGYSRALLGKYLASGRLQSPAHGVYRRPGPPLKWQHIVASLQLLSNISLHVGGRTALVHRGLGHYIQMTGPETISLYGPDMLPGWVSKLGLGERFVVRNDAMFASLRVRRNKGGALVDMSGHELGEPRVSEFGLTVFNWGAWDWPLLYSSEERAIFEVLQDVPGRESIYEADVLMQGLANLRPKRVMALLQSCASVKAKRLFLALAERHEHAWFGHLDLGRIDLGKGKRMLSAGGRLHPEYLITLPADLDDHAR